ncbi:transcription factor bHLH18-like protein [Tanacetum coccineum]
MEDPCYFMDQHQPTYPYNELLDPFSSQGFKGYMNLVTRSEAIHAATISKELDSQGIHKVTRTNSFTPIGGPSSNTFTISFGDHSSSTEINQNTLHGGFKLKYDDVMQPKLEMSLDEFLGSIELPKRVSTTRRNHRQAQEHVLAERKRREKLTRRFISLSALLPEIKKMDKATVLEDASKYIKYLQNRVKELEETSVSGKNIIHESPTSMSKIHGGHEDNASTFDDTNSLSISTANDLGIKVKISGSHTLVKIYCQRNSSLALRAIIEMESLHFSIMCNNVLPISGNAALITIIAQMSEEIGMTAMNLVNCLQSSLSNFLDFLKEFGCVHSFDESRVP